MYIALETIDVWCFEDEFPPDRFLRQLGKFLQDGDVLAFGAYNPSARSARRLEGMGATQKDAGTIYGESFQMNRAEHPDGRPFELTMSEAILNALIDEAGRADGQTDKPLFFDHFVAYRRGVPLVPLLCFHDAFAAENCSFRAFTPNPPFARLPLACLPLSRFDAILLYPLKVSFFLAPRSQALLGNTFSLEAPLP